MGRLAKGVVLLAVAVVLIQTLPDVVRYLKIRQM
jgi:hypothetical protein